MRQIAYAMQFRGKAAPVSQSPMTLKASLRGSGCKITTQIGDAGVSGALEALSGDSASFESEVMFTGDSSFKESGTITFGSKGDRLSFSTLGEGYLGACADPKLKHGSVTWKVDGGEGQFERASGLITSNFLVGETGDVIDHHFAVIFLK